MKSLVLMALAFVAVGYCKPRYFEWLETKPKERVVKAVTKFEIESEWEDFKKTYNKNYELGEETERRIFQDNLDYIIQHNEKYNTGEKSYQLGINQFADMTTEEFRRYNGLRANRFQRPKCSRSVRFSFPTLRNATMDWRTMGYVTPVKDQGQCGSSWAFSATGSLEGQHFRQTRDLKSLSEQQLVDCSGKFGNHGCRDGVIDDAFEYIKATGGIESERIYPYTAEEGRCEFSRPDVVATITGCVDVRRGSEDDLLRVLAQVGPISATIDASQRSFQFYRSGVYNEPLCSSTQLDHGVLVVGYGTAEGKDGYGTTEGKDYWLVKNSWGTTWGDDGYALMSRNDGNQCGIATQASYPLVGNVTQLHSGLLYRKSKRSRPFYRS